MIKTRIINDDFTHNSFKTYDRCKRKYYYEYVKKLHWPGIDSDYELGLSVHKLLDYQAKGFNVDIFLKSCRIDIKELWSYLYNSEIIKYPVIESEWAFNTKINSSNYWVQGRIDRLVKIDKKKYAIIDFKTGQQLPSTKTEDWQSIVYLFCTVSAKNFKPEEIEFWYYRVEKEPEIRIIKYDSDLHKLFESKISNKINEILSTNTWNISENCNKKYCPYTVLCSK
ncbi:MAG: PD-(D/E)XK nuclease family protein [Cyanobacteriota bacterium]